MPTNRLTALNPLQQPNIPQQFVAGRQAGVALQDQQTQRNAQAQQQRDQRRNQAMKALAYMGPEQAQAMGYSFDPEMLQEITAQPDWQNNLIRFVGGTPGQIDKDFMKEERSQASQALKGFNKRASEMRGAFGKVTGLADQAKAGSRQARAAMTMNVARLISPGVVTDRDAAQLSGAQDPMAFVMNLLSGRDPDTAALIRNYDPFGPNFDVEGLLNVARSVTTAEAPALIDQYEQSRNRATRSGMNKRQFQTIFGGNKNLEEISKFLEQTTTPPGGKSPQDMTDEEILEELRQLGAQ